MPQAPRSSTSFAPTSPLAAAASALSAACACVPRAMRETAWQDGLDLLATIAGLKPLCLIGRGFADPAWNAALRSVAAAAALPVLEAAPWFPAAEPGFFPNWYLAAAARRRHAPVTYICGDEATRQRAAALSASGRVSAEEEAVLLGYPPCCVAQHHRRALAVERLVIEMLARVARGDLERMARLVEARVEPLPATDEEWRRLASLTAIRPSPGTSLNMCDLCADDPASAAAAMSRHYARLAAAAGYTRA